METKPSSSSLLEQCAYIATTLLFVAKISELAKISWLVVFAPVLLYWGLGLALLILVGVFYVFVKPSPKGTRRK